MSHIKILEMDVAQNKIKEIGERIDKLNIRQFKKQLLNNLRLNYRLQSVTKEEYQQLGNTRIGGLPDLPKSYDYPINENGYYNLILQLNFSELKAQLPKIPEHGILYLFQGAENSDDFKTIFIEETINLEKKSPPKNTYNLNKENRLKTYDGLKASFDLEHYFEGEIIWKINDLNPVIYNELTRTKSTYNTQILAEPYGGLDAIKNAYLAINHYDTLMFNVIGLYPVLEEPEYQNQLQFLIKDCDDKMKNPNSNSAHFIKKKEQLLNFDKNRELHLAKYTNTKCILSIESLTELNWQWGDMGEINMYMDAEDLVKKQFQNSYIDIVST